jgi:plasmid stability protein
MASITIRNLDDFIKARLRMRAARHGRSMEDEARTILRTVLGQENAQGINLVQCILARFGPLGDVDLPQPEREGMREPPGRGG